MAKELCGREGPGQSLLLRIAPSVSAEAKMVASRRPDLILRRNHRIKLLWSVLFENFGSWRFAELRETPAAVIRSPSFDSLKEVLNGAWRASRIISGELWHECERLSGLAAKHINRRYLVSGS